MRLVPKLKANANLSRPPLIDLQPKEPDTEPDGAKQAAIVSFKQSRQKTERENLSPTVIHDTEDSPATHTDVYQSSQQPLLQQGQKHQRPEATGKDVHQMIKALTGAMGILAGDDESDRRQGRGKGRKRAKQAEQCEPDLRNALKSSWNGMSYLERLDVVVQDNPAYEDDSTEPAYKPFFLTTQATDSIPELSESVGNDVSSPLLGCKSKSSDSCKRPATQLKQSTKTTTKKSGQQQLSPLRLLPPTGGVNKKKSQITARIKRLKHTEKLFAAVDSSPVQPMRRIQITDITNTRAQTSALPSACKAAQTASKSLQKPVDRVMSLAVTQQLQSKQPNAGDSDAEGVELDDDDEEHAEVQQEPNPETRKAQKQPGKTAKRKERVAFGSKPGNKSCDASTEATNEQHIASDELPVVVRQQQKGRRAGSAKSSITSQTKRKNTHAAVKQQVGSAVNAVTNNMAELLQQLHDCQEHNKVLEKQLAGEQQARQEAELQLAKLQDVLQHGDSKQERQSDSHDHLALQQQLIETRQRLKDAEAARKNVLLLLAESFVRTGQC